MLQLYTRLFWFLILLGVQVTLSAQTEYIVTVNPGNCALSKIDSISGIRMMQSSAAYNETTKEYTVMGTWEPGQSPTYLYTIDATTGNVLYSPQISSPNRYISFQYSKTTGVLYCILFENSTYYLATLSKTTGQHTIIQSIPGIDAVAGFTIDEANQRLYVRAVDNNPNFALWTIDLQTGNILYHVPTQNTGGLIYDNTSHNLYALAISGYNTSIGTIDCTTGAVSTIASLPAGTGIYSGQHETLNENDRLYYFAGVDALPGSYLFALDLLTGAVVSKLLFNSSGTIEHDNLAFFRYDNLSDTLYAMLWEAHTVNDTTIREPTSEQSSPLLPSSKVDSSCNLMFNTKVYLHPSNNKLMVDKKPTLCNVTLDVYNIWGQHILKNVRVSDGENEFNLDEISTAVYYYHLVSNGERLLAGKIVKQ